MENSDDAFSAVVDQMKLYRGMCVSSCVLESHSVIQRKLRACQMISDVNMPSELHCRCGVLWVEVTMRMRAAARLTPSSEGHTPCTTINHTHRIIKQ